MNHLFDAHLVGTPMRGIVRIGGLGILCAYLGVPREHWMAGLEDLHFRCHFGITWNQAGDDEHLPAGWHWYGWDYGHFTDHVEELERAGEMMLGLPASSALWPKNKWTLGEVVEDLMDSATSLLEAMSNAERIVPDVLAQSQSIGPVYAPPPVPSIVEEERLRAFTSARVCLQLLLASIQAKQVSAIAKGELHPFGADYAADIKDVERRIATLKPRDSVLVEEILATHGEFFERHKDYLLQLDADGSVQRLRSLARGT